MSVQNASPTFKSTSRRSGLRVTGLIQAASLAALAVITPGALATDGYFASGYGVKAKGRAGVALAEFDDSFGGANNPATIAYAESRVDVGVEWFRPDRSASRSGATGPAAALNGGVTSSRDNFFVPEISYRTSLSRSVSAALTIYGNGGMNTDYAPGQLNLGPGASGLNLLAAPGNLGVNLSQLLIAPTLAWEFAPGHSLGIAPVVAYQRFKAYGLGAFAGLSQDPAALTDRGVAQSWGIGVRPGYLWKVNESVALGLAYSSRVYSEGFSKYRGLFAGGGSFDIPQSIGTGIGWQVFPSVKVGLDYKWIDYAGIDPVGNSGALAGKLGQSSGPGFGWRSISVVKVGADWKLSDHWTLRGGYGWNENPVGASDVTFNILAPGVVQHHAAVGVTFSHGHHEVSAAYVHAFENSVSGESRLVALALAPAGTTEEITMSQDSFALAYSYKF